MAGGSSGPSGPIAGINVTPLVDVVLVLLIVLMVTASAIVSQSIPLDLPQAATGESTEAPLTLSIDRDGAYFLDGEASTREAIDAHLVTLGESAASLRVVLEADGARPHAEVIGLIDLVRRHGVVHFAMHVQPTETARSEADSAAP